MAQVKFRCECGQKMIASESRKGKTLTCPGCGKPVEVPQNAEAVDPKVYENVKRFSISCRCEQKMIVKEDSIGKELFCPKCGEKIKVERPKPSDSDSEKPEEILKFDDGDDLELSLLDE